MRHFHLQSGEFEAIVIAFDEHHARERFEEELFPGCVAETCEDADFAALETADELAGELVGCA